MWSIESQITQRSTTLNLSWMIYVYRLCNLCMCYTSSECNYLSGFDYQSKCWLSLTFADKVFSFMSFTPDTVRRWNVIVDIIHLSLINKESINQFIRTLSYIWKQRLLQKSWMMLYLRINNKRQIDESQLIYKGILSLWHEVIRSETW